MCDVQINYENTAFHLHAAILALNSVYFKNLFEETIDKSSIQLPIMKDFCDRTIDAKHIKSFIDTVYSYDPIKYNDVLGSNWCIYPLIYLSHYFQTERLEKNLKSIVTEFVFKGRIGYDGRIYFALLLSCQGAKWNETQKELIQYIAGDFRSLQSDCKLYWPKLNSNIKQQIYLTTISKASQPYYTSETERIAREVSETIVETSTITEILPSPEWEKVFRDTIAEAVLLAAMKQKKVVS